MKSVRHSYWVDLNLETLVFCVLSFLCYFVRFYLLTTSGWRFPMFLVMADTRVGEALYPNFRDLKFFPRLIGLMVDGWLLHPNMMYLPVTSFFSSLTWFTWRSVPVYPLLIAEILLHDWHLEGCGLSHPGCSGWPIYPLDFSIDQVYLEVIISVPYWEA